MRSNSGTTRALRRAAALASLAGVTLTSGCVATAAVVTTAYAVELIEEQGYTVTVKAEAKPRDLYNKLLATLKARNPNIEIIEENHAERRLRARAVDPDGTRKWVSLVVAPLPDETSQLLISAGYGGKDGREIRDWMLEQLDQVFREMGIEWKIAAADAPSDAARLAGSQSGGERPPPAHALTAPTQG